MSKWRNGWNDTEVYSTNEVKTNKVWIDGKPIYRKTWYSATNWADGATVGTISNLDMVISVISTTWNYQNDSYYTNWGTSTDRGNAHVVANSGVVIAERYGAYAGSTKPSIIIVEYTKTTD